MTMELDLKDVLRQYTTKAHELALVGQHEAAGCLIALLLIIQNLSAQLTTTGDPPAEAPSVTDTE